MDDAMVIIAKREDWKTLPLPEARAKLVWSRRFTADEWAQIIRGTIPGEMEEKWFIFFENETLNIHRSWTGRCIYQAICKQSGDEWFGAEAWANRNPEEYPETHDGFDAVFLDWVIDTQLLGRESKLPIRRSEFDKLSPGLTWPWPPDDMLVYDDLQSVEKPRGNWFIRWFRPRK